MRNAAIYARFSSDKQRDASIEDQVRACRREATFDVDGFADFLPRGLTLDDRTLLDAFVWQVRVGTERAVVILNYDQDGAPVTSDLLRKRFEDVDNGGTIGNKRSPA